MTNPRHKERHLARNGRDFIDLGLKTMDRVEKGKSFFEALGEAFGEVRTRREQEEKDHPVGPGLPIGFRSPAERAAERAADGRDAEDRTRDAEPVTVTATVMKQGIPYCTAHDIPYNVCSMCRNREKAMK
jgi:hypothetical protein